MTVTWRVLGSRTTKDLELLVFIMPYRIYYLQYWHPITDPVERQIAKTAILRSLRAQYRRIKYAYGPPKAFRWVIW